MSSQTKYVKTLKIALLNEVYDKNILAYYRINLLCCHASNYLSPLMTVIYTLREAFAELPEEVGFMSDYSVQLQFVVKN